VTTSAMPEQTELARQLAREAGKIIRDSLPLKKEISHKAAVDLVTNVDLRAEKIICEGISRAFPDHAIVAEENHFDRSDQDWCWYVDPLDGTINYVHGIPHCSVSIALLHRGAPVASAVYDPFRDEMYHARAGAGAFLNDSPVAVSPTTALEDSLLVTGFPYDRRENLGLYLPYFEHFLVNARDVRRFGSAALDLCYLACGRFDGFWEWKLQPWDTAAGWLVVTEAGGTVSDFNGDAYDPWTPRVLASNGLIEQEFIAHMGRIAAGS